MAGKKIIWVDDDEDILAAFTPSLESQGWQVRTAPNAEEGKALAVEEKPDLIIMDIIMEGEHGYSAIEELVSNPDLANVPIIVFSSVTHRWGQTTATREEALLSSAAEFVDKSGGPQALVEAVRNHLNK